MPKRTRAEGRIAQAHQGRRSDCPSAPGPKVRFVVQPRAQPWVNDSTTRAIGLKARHIVDSRHETTGRAVGPSERGFRR